MRLQKMKYDCIISNKVKNGGQHNGYNKRDYNKKNGLFNERS